MEQIKEEDYINGNLDDIYETLILEEDCNAYIDSVVEQIYSLNLTEEEQKSLGIKLFKDAAFPGWKTVKFVLGPGEEISLKKYIRKHGEETTLTEYEITCNGQSESEKLIGLISGFGVIGSHRILSYRGKTEKLSFNRGTEKEILIRDENDTTQYLKLGATKLPKFSDTVGYYSSAYRSSDSYTETYKNGTSTYFDSEGKPLKQPELIVTTNTSVENALNNFDKLFATIRELIDARVQEITNKKLNKKM